MKHYRFFTGSFLIIVLFAWTFFNDAGSLKLIQADTGSQVEEVNRGTDASVSEPETVSIEQPAVPASGVNASEEDVPEASATDIIAAEAPDEAADAQLPEETVETAVTEEPAQPEAVQTSETATAPDSTSLLSTAVETPDAAAGCRYKICVANVDTSVNIRSGPDSSYPIIGKMYDNYYATIIDHGTEWTKIRSGSKTGYVSNEFFIFDDEARELVDSYENSDGIKVRIEASKVNLRSAPGTDSEIVRKASRSETFAYAPAYDAEGWLAIYLEDGSVAYISGEFGDIVTSLSPAVWN